MVLNFKEAANKINVILIKIDNHAVILVCLSNFSFLRK